MADKDIIDDLEKSRVKPSHEMQDGAKNRDIRSDIDKDVIKAPRNELHQRNIAHAIEKNKKSKSKHSK